MKKSRIIGIVLICLVALILLVTGALLIKNHIDMKKPLLQPGYYTAFQSTAALEKKYAGLGSYAVTNTVMQSADETIENFRIWYPVELENTTREYPLILVTNASNMAALNYEAYFERLASWGFVVAGNDDRQAGTGASTAKTLDYLLELNQTPDSAFYAKIDTNNIGAVGYSQGGAGAINAVTAFDNSTSYKALFTGSAAYALLAKNMGWEYDVSKITIPYFMTAGTGHSDDTGAVADTEFGGVAPLSSLLANYEKIPENAFKLRARVSGAEHEDIQVRTDGYMTAWMLYHLQGDEEAGKAFLSENAEILRNAGWQDIEKNK